MTNKTIVPVTQAELEACPFCEDGGSPVIWKIKRFREVACQYCKCSGPLCDSEAEAITAWNTRQPSAPEATDVAGLVEKAKWNAAHYAGAVADEWQQAADALASQAAAQATLFGAIQHGDDEHRAWLKEAIDAHFAGQPVPEPKGSGRKDAEIARLREVLGKGERHVRWQAKTTGCSDQLYNWLDEVRGLTDTNQGGSDAD